MRQVMGDMTWCDVGDGGRHDMTCLRVDLLNKGQQVVQVLHLITRRLTVLQRLRQAGRQAGGQAGRKAGRITCRWSGGGAGIGTHAAVKRMLVHTQPQEVGAHTTSGCWCTQNLRMLVHTQPQEVEGVD